MRTFICIMDEHGAYLTLGKIYKTINDTHICDDLGTRRSFSYQLARKTIKEIMPLKEYIKLLNQ